MKTDDRPEGEQWQMDEWMRDVWTYTPYFEWMATGAMSKLAKDRDGHEYAAAVLVNCFTKLHNAGLLLTREQKRDYDEFKTYLEQLPDGYDIGDDLTVEFAIKLAKNDTDLTRLKAENEHNTEAVQRAHNEIVGLQAENEQMREALEFAYADDDICADCRARINAALGADDE